MPNCRKENIAAFLFTGADIGPIPGYVHVFLRLLFVAACILPQWFGLLMHGLVGDTAVHCLYQCLNLVHNASWLGPQPWPRYAEYVATAPF